MCVLVVCSLFYVYCGKYRVNIKKNYFCNRLVLLVNVYFMEM